MSEYVNTGAYLRTLWDELRYNMELQLKNRGYEDVSPSHGWIFHYTEDSGSRVTDLAAVAKITKQSMSTLVAQLEKSGYVKKNADPSDKRAWLLVLTPKGRKVREAGKAINYEFEKKWQTKLGNKDYQELRHLLARLCE